RILVHPLAGEAAKPCLGGRGTMVHPAPCLRHVGCDRHLAKPRVLRAGGRGGIPRALYPARESGASQSADLFLSRTRARKVRALESVARRAALSKTRARRNREQPCAFVAHLL